VKPRPVAGLDPKGSFRTNAARIIMTRLDELHGFDPAIRDPSNVTQLHDMRIAAKRLRYVLEIVGFAFGTQGRTLEQEAKWLQEVLGEIHDCDVLVPLVDEQVRALRKADRDYLITNGLSAVASVPNAARYRGLETLVAFLEARRMLLYDEFLDHWDRLLASGFRARAQDALA
jgi:CHAD domain-containing protein